MSRGRPRPRPPRRLRRPPGQIDLTRVAGLAAVTALFANSPERVERLFFLGERASDVESFCQELARRRKPYRRVAVDELARVAGTAMHGGVVALARPRPVLPFDPDMAESWRKLAPLVLALDGIGNPHNLGAIVRTAAFFGLDRLIVSDHPAQAGPSDAAHRVAEGGLEFVQMYRAAGLPDVLKRVKPAYRVLGTALGVGRPVEQVRIDRPILLVLGNEESGLDPASQAACDEIVTVPGSGWVQSLNVAATAAILIHYFSRVGRPA
ncbi:MAG: RNA methyltransferase [Alphaproteobacteria bacterium]|nr:RNA methyltransferase [Alphaproteobacteria bacterium]